MSSQSWAPECVWVRPERAFPGPQGLLAARAPTVLPLPSKSLSSAGLPTGPSAEIIRSPITQKIRRIHKVNIRKTVTRYVPTAPTSAFESP